MSDDLREPYNPPDEPPMWFTLSLALAILGVVVLGWHWWKHHG
jgi:hypothetical protein